MESFYTSRLDYLVGWLEDTVTEQTYFLMFETFIAQHRHSGFSLFPGHICVTSGSHFVEAQTRWIFANFRHYAPFMEVIGNVPPDKTQETQASTRLGRLRDSAVYETQPVYENRDSGWLVLHTHTDCVQQVGSSGREY